MKGFMLRAMIVLAVMIVGIIFVIPTFKPGVWPHKRVNLGLDLQGGMQLTLHVETNVTVANTVDRTRGDLVSSLREARIRHGAVKSVGKDEISVPLTNSDDIDNLKTLLQKQYPDFAVKSVARDKSGNLDAILGITSKAAMKIKKDAIRQAWETIRNRVDQFGVNSPDIRIQGDKRILVQLPGIKDTKRAKELIGKTAQLSFKLVDENHSVQSALNGNVPPGDEILYGTNDANSHSQGQAYLVEKRSLLTGNYLKNAQVAFGQYNQPYLSIQFDRKGAEIFARVTGDNVHKRLAIVLDNKVYSAPVIQERIPGGSARITGDFTVQQAHDLAIVLRAGALPAPVKIVQETSVGPTLGADSIREGIISMAVGGILVVLFMAIYYQIAGLVANLALILNILLIIAGLAAFQATLTLPGMAGIILTIGMAVDGNVIIFERIREELRLGKNPAAALAAGFERATVTVLDANVTTVIAALVLYQFGTGPVKGFAVTLSIGVVASCFTALTVCRLIFDYLYEIRRFKTFSI